MQWNLVACAKTNNRNLFTGLRKLKISNNKLNTWCFGGCFPSYLVCYQLSFTFLLISCTQHPNSGWLFCGVVMIDDANITDYRQILLDIARSLGAENLLNAWTMCRMRNWIDEYGEITSEGVAQVLSFKKIATITP